MGSWLTLHLAGKSDGGPLQLGLQFTRGVDDEQRKSMVRQQFARGQEGAGPPENWQGQRRSAVVQGKQTAAGLKVRPGQLERPHAQSTVLMDPNPQVWRALACGWQLWTSAYWRACLGYAAAVHQESTI